MQNNLKEQLCETCKLLAESGMSDALLSIKDAETGVIALKSAAVEPADVALDDVVLVDADGNVLEGDPAALTPYFTVHKALYDHCPGITAVVQPNGRWSCIWAQLGRLLPPTSYLHARHFAGEILCTGSVMLEDGEDLYAATADCVCRTLKNKGIHERGALFMRNDGALVWGQNPIATAKRAVVLDELCFRAIQVSAVAQGADSYVAFEVGQQLLEKE